MSSSISPPSSISSSLSDGVEHETAPIFNLRRLLKETLRVHVSDGRVFLGTFMGTDQLLNILLVNTEEYRFATGRDSEPSSRFVGQVMIPWRLIIQVEATGGKLKELGNGGTTAESRQALYI
ncbi:hypothetical protein BJ138DRAFT_867437 [Hygrophoropsis aurantiaca]|uniref:Uncharacterized protein n=1 Tax=Hygrophoropsis aurantiaca TaxID=72124 RepID=A0ACB8AG07_9AGAM|nr:hypothetical protein BJ138DRAFT_867437 [Hygrophoropsis aurantiaca]